MKIENLRTGMRVRISNNPVRFDGDLSIVSEMRKFFGKVYEVGSIYSDGCFSLIGTDSYTWHILWVEEVNSCKLKEKRKRAKK